MSDPTIDRQQVIADLQAARNELVTRGRTIGKRVRPDGSVCALGAINVAIDPQFEALYLDGDQTAGPMLYDWVERDTSPRVRAARAQLRGLLPDDLPVWAFNDDPETTDEDVVALFDKALADLGGLA